MHSKFIIGLMLILPLTSVAACGSDDDDNGGTAGASASGGRAGAGSAGRSGAGGRNSAAGTAGTSVDSAGTAGEEGVDAGSGGTGPVDAGGRGGTGAVGGTSGSAGRGGSAGSGGTAGKGGSAGGGGTAGSGGSGGSGGNGGRAGAGGSSGGGGNGGRAGAGGSGGGAGSASAGTSGTAGTSGGGGTGSFAMLTNANVVKVLATANQGEVSVALVAQPAAQRPSVKNFAAMMIADHNAANAQTLALVATKHIAPAASDVSEHLETETATLLATLSQTPSADFDRVYMQSQVAMHQEVLTLIDTRLLPDATDADLKALLTTVRASVSMHLQTAQTIVASL